MDLITWFMDNAINLRSVTYFAASAPFSPVLTFNPNERVNPPPVAQLCCYGFQGVAALTAYCSTTLTCLQLNGTRCYSYTPRASAAEAEELFHALNSAPNLIHLHLTQIVFARQSDTIRTRTWIRRRFCRWITAMGPSRASIPVRPAMDGATASGRARTHPPNRTTPPTRRHRHLRTASQEVRATLSRARLRQRSAFRRIAQHAPPPVRVVRNGKGTCLPLASHVLKFIC